MSALGARCVVRRDHLILVVRRSSHDAFEPGLWEVPGGRSRPGETLVEAARREVKEETGLDVDVGPAVSTWQCREGWRRVSGVTFLAYHRHGEVVLSDEHDEYAWVSLERARRLPLAMTIGGQLRDYRDAVAALSRPQDGKVGDASGTGEH